MRPDGLRSSRRSKQSSLRRTSALIAVIGAFVSTSLFAPEGAQAEVDDTFAAQSTDSFAFGIHARSDDESPTTVARDVSYLGARVARVAGFRGSATVEQLRAVKEKFDAKGIEVILVAEADGAGPTAEEARNLAAWAKYFGPGGPYAGTRPLRHIEFGNENGAPYHPKAGPNGGATYANNYRIAYDAINGPNGNSSVGLLAQADSANAGSRWVDLMFKAQPGLAAMVGDNGGWVVHPYGPRLNLNGTRGWKKRLDELVSQTAKWGAPATIPIFITEWGVVSTRDGRCLDGDNTGWAEIPGSGGRCMNYEQAANALRSTVRQMRADPNFGRRIRTFILYVEHDLRAEPGDGGPVTKNPEQYFGALKAPWYGLTLEAGRRDKGAFTSEVKHQAQLAGYRSDIANFHPDNGRWWVSTSTGRGFTTGMWSDYEKNSGWTSQVVGDFNGE